MKKYIVFGTGKYSIDLLKHIDRGDIAYFCDNNRKKVGQVINGIKIISFEELVKIHDEYIIIVAIERKLDVEWQFKKAGIKNYIFYEGDEYRNTDISTLTGINFVDYTIRENDVIYKFCEENKGTFTIENFHQFKENTKRLKQYLKGGYAFYAGSLNCNETLMYGQAKDLMEYADIEVDYARFPKVAHGPFYSGIHPGFGTACMFSGEFDKEEHNRRYPYVPVFVTGPTIRYSKPIYSIDEYTDFKIRNGIGEKVVLVFVAHNTEQSHTGYDEKRLIENIIKISNEYDSVLVSVYWADTDSGFYEELEKKGDGKIKLVSNGFRFDETYNKKQRFLFDICDKVIVFGWTSAAMFGLALGKDITVIDIDEKIDNKYKDLKDIPHLDSDFTDMSIRLKNLFFNKYGKKNNELNSEEIEMLNSCYGLNIKRSKYELRAIYEICCDIWKNSGFKLHEYPLGVYKTFQQYQEKYEFEKSVILSEAINQHLWIV